MRLAGLVALFAAAFTFSAAPAVAQQVNPDDPSPEVRACIADNAANVERIFASLDEGVNFLVQKVCAGPLASQAAEFQRRQVEQQKQAMEKACVEMKAQADNLTDGIRQDPMMMQMCNNPMMDVYQDMVPMAAGLYGGMDSPQATSLAAQTLLRLRAEKTPKR